MKELFKSFSIFALLTLALNWGTAQNSVNGDDKIISQAIEKISKYTYNQSGFIDEELQRIGFSIPKNISPSQWNSFPTIRKLEWAYISAGNNGEKMLALLSKSLAQQYESAGRELNRFVEIPAPPKIAFSTIQALPATSSLPADFQQAIKTMAKYIDDGAGVNKILTHYWNIDENTAYEIQRNSVSNEDALKKGISKFNDVDVQKLKIKSVVTEFHSTYESSRYETSFKPFGNDYNSPDIPGSPLPKQPNRGGGVGSVGGSQSKLASQKYSKVSQYREFMAKNYKAPSTRRFTRMKSGKGGFGGVIFGSPITIDKALIGLDSVLWVSELNNLKGTLIFKYKNSLTKYVKDVNFEDVYAAYNLIYVNDDTLTNFKEGNGIGLASLSYGLNSSNGSGYTSYDDKSKREILIHPAIANLNIGWSLIYSDIVPIIKQSVLHKIKNSSEKNRTEKILANFGDWKVTDVPLFVTSNGDEIIIKNNQKTAIPNTEEIYFSMTGLAGKKICDNKIDSTAFNSIAPILYKYDYNYKRINDFAKIFALIRYAKISKSKISELPAFNNFVEQPHFITLDSTGVAFEKPADEGINWKKRISNQLNLISTKNEASEIYNNISFYDSLVKAREKVNDSLWVKLDDWFYSGSLNTTFCANYSINELDDYIKQLRLKKAYFVVEDSIVNNDAGLRKQKTEIERITQKINVKYDQLESGISGLSLRSNCKSIYENYVLYKTIYQSELKSKEDEKRLLNLLIEREGCNCPFYKNSLIIIDNLKNERDTLQILYYSKINANKELSLLRLLLNENKALSFLLNRSCE